MKNSAESLQKTEAINMRIDKQTKSLIDHAAKLSGIDRTKFMLLSAVEKAEEVIFSNSHHWISPEEFSAIEEAINANPMESNSCLIELLNHPDPWST